jgi:hypothetical protein
VDVLSLFVCWSGRLDSVVARNSELSAAKNRIVLLSHSVLPSIRLKQKTNPSAVSCII